MTLEICANGLHSALAAQQGGAQRVELCSGLNEGGLTPSIGLIEKVRKLLSIELYILIRPRAGDFMYDSEEFDVILADVMVAKLGGANGIVTGMLTEHGEVDTEKMKYIVDAAYPLPVTFHRAFDMVSMPHSALEKIIDLGCRRILTSGQALVAEQGIQLLKKLVEQAGDRISIMPGSGIRPHNIRKIAVETGATEFHASALCHIDSKMRYRKNGISMSGNLAGSEYTHAESDTVIVRSLVQNLQRVQ